MDMDLDIVCIQCHILKQLHCFQQPNIYATRDLPGYDTSGGGGWDDVSYGGGSCGRVTELCNVPLILYFALYFRELMFCDVNTLIMNMYTLGCVEIGRTS